MDEPIVVCGAMASRSAASAMNAPDVASFRARRRSRGRGRELGLDDVIHRRDEAAGRVEKDRTAS
jgi:hypothetical protein